ncbi:P-loop containing nucleoside triphosphate hydrolase protein [Lentinula edodes]|nr:P-loop containing nucleoside triphosphate hydrolase protein [Lentinula edodes]
MSVNTHPVPSLTKFRFNSAAGHALISRIVCLYLPYTPHDYVLEGIGHVLDRTDLVAITPTGSGKTGYMAFTALVVRELTLCPEKYPETAQAIQNLPKNPLMLTICPTNYMEYQLEENLAKMSLEVLIINEETTKEAHKKALPDLWRRAQDDTRVSVLLMSPEQLHSKGYEIALTNKSFYHRIYALAVDEVHLLLSWGKSFRQPFRQIGLARARLPDRVVLISLTATMRGGRALKTVCRFLGLQDGRFHLIRRSNQRPDIQLIFREISSPVNGRSFPELDWVLAEKRKTIIFTRHINLGNRLHEYMYHRDQELGSDPRTVLNRMREYNSLSEDYNQVTRTLMRSGDCSVVFGTSSLAIGVDIEKVQDVVLFGDPLDLDELLQMLGHIRPNWDIVPHGNKPTHRGIIYFSPNSLKRAEQSLTKHNKPSDQKITELEDSEADMDIGLAEILTAKCKVENIDSQYENPEQDSLCLCPTCTARPPYKGKQQCFCSNCYRDQPPLIRKIPKLPTTPLPALEPPKKHQKITASQRLHGTAELKRFRLQMFREAEDKSCSMLPLELYFPDEEIQQVLDNFASLKEVEDIGRLLPRNHRLLIYRQQLFDCVNKLGAEFKEIKAAEKQKRDGAKQAAGQALNIEDLGTGI